MDAVAPRPNVGDGKRLGGCMATQGSPTPSSMRYQNSSQSMFNPPQFIFRTVVVHLIEGQSRFKGHEKVGSRIARAMVLDGPFNRFTHRRKIQRTTATRHKVPLVLNVLNVEKHPKLGHPGQALTSYASFHRLSGTCGMILRSNYNCRVYSVVLLLNVVRLCVCQY